MITAVEIENFKGVRERTRIEIRPITLLFGPNSAGKSTLLHALQLAREVFTRRNLDVDVTDGGASFIDLGGFRNYVHGRDLTKAVTLRFDLDLRDTNFLTEFPIAERVMDLPNPTEGTFDLSQIGDEVKSGWVEVTAKWDYRRACPYVVSYTIGLDGEFLATIATAPEQPDHVALTRLNLWHPIFTWPNGATMEDAASIGLLDAFQPALRSLTQFMYVRGDSVTGRNLAEDSEREVVVFAEGDGFPEDRNYRWVHMYDSSTGGTFDVALSRRSDSRSIRVHSLHFLLDNYPLYEGEDAAHYSERLRSTGCRLLEEQLQRVADEEDALLDISVVGMVGALPEIDAALRFAFPEPYEHERIAEDEAAAAALLNRLLLVPARALRLALNEFRYIGPVRDAVPRNFAPPRFLEPRRWAGGLAAWDELSRHPQTLVPQVSEWLSGAERLNTGYRLQLRSFRELSTEDELTILLESPQTFEDLDTDEFKALLRDILRAVPLTTQPRLVSTAIEKEMHPADVGQGITQVIPIVVAVLHPFDHGGSPRGGLVAIEQPELHLHPAAQVGLGDLFITAVHKLRGQRLLIETHSEHLLLRILRRIRQTSSGALPLGHPGLTTAQLAVVCFEPPGGGGPARVYSLRVDDQGEFLDPWPRGFFDERSEELFGP